MRNQFLGGVAIAIASVLASQIPVNANPSTGLNRLSMPQLNRLGRDLHQPSPSEDFFRQGQKQLEREIQQLSRRPTDLPEALLKVTPDEREFQPVPNEQQQQQQRSLH